MARRTWSFVVLAAALLTSLMVAFAPIIVTSSCETTAEAIRCSSSRGSLVDSEGAGVLGVLTVPPLLAVLPLFARWDRAALATAVALTVTTLVAIASVGIFYLPVVALSWVAAFATSRTGPDSPDSAQP